MILTEYKHLPRKKKKEMKKAWSAAIEHYRHLHARVIWETIDKQNYEL